MLRFNRGHGRVVDADKSSKNLVDTKVTYKTKSWYRVSTVTKISVVQIAVEPTNEIAPQTIQKQQHQQHQERGHVNDAHKLLRNIRDSRNIYRTENSWLVDTVNEISVVRTDANNMSEQNTRKR